MQTIEEAKAFIAFKEAQEKFIDVKQAWRADPGDKKKEAAYRKAQADFTPKVAAYRAQRRSPNGPGDGVATPDAFGASTTALRPGS